MVVNFTCQLGCTTVSRYVVEHYSGYLCKGVFLFLKINSITVPTVRPFPQELALVLDHELAEVQRRADPRAARLPAPVRATAQEQHPGGLQHALARRPPTPPPSAKPRRPCSCAASMSPQTPARRWRRSSSSPRAPRALHSAVVTSRRSAAGAMALRPGTAGKPPAPAVSVDEINLYIHGPRVDYPPLPSMMGMGLIPSVEGLKNKRVPPRARRNSAANSLWTQKATLPRVGLQPASLPRQIVDSPSLQNQVSQVFKINLSVYVLTPYWFCVPEEP